jgi:two-component system cell cycle response regulator
MKVLVADDDLVARRVLTTLLGRWGYDVVVAADGDAAWAVLSGPDAPRIAILDWEMPGADGVEICHRLRADVSQPYTYVLLVTGREARGDVLAGLNSGADDYVTKPFDAAELGARLRVGRRIATLQKELITAGEMLRYQALHDGLTGVLNRAGILEILASEASDLGRNGGSLGALMVDLDHFKRINDTWGHAAGDAVLREVVRRIAGVVRPYDQVGRVGGEEFLVLLPLCSMGGAVEVAERVRLAVRDEPVVFDRGSLRVTCSIGVATTETVDGCERLVREADHELYRAKNLGRDRVVAPEVEAVFRRAG